MSLKPLNSLKAPDLISFDREAIAEEVMERMRTLPGWSDIWTAVQYQDASQFVIQTFAYMFEKVATAANKTVRESLLSEAFSEAAIYANLNQMRCDTIQAKAASVTLVGRIENATLTDILTLDRSFKVATTDSTGARMYFEIIPINANNEYEYTEAVSIEPGTYASRSFSVTAYAGETKRSASEMTIYDLEHLRVKLPYAEIIDGSVAVYYVSPGGTTVRLLSADSFVSEPVYSSPTVFPNGTPHYVVQYNAEGSATIYFGSAAFGGAFEAEHIGGTLVTYCRVGGGIVSNIPAYHVNTKAEIERFGYDPLYVTFTNPEPSTGGADREDAETARIFAPLRYGRQGAAILLDDAKNLLYRSVVKHEIETPRYSEVANNVPLLHTFHYIVPTRDFSTVSLPGYETGETLESYLGGLYAYLNQYCQITGTNEETITDELVAYFDEIYNAELYEFVYSLLISGPMSGSLGLSAWDYEGDRVDYLTWAGNYYGTTQLQSHISDDHAIIDTSAFESLTITAGTNDIIKVMFDGYAYVFELILAATNSATATNIAEQCNTQMHNLIMSDPVAIAGFGAYANYPFFSTVEVSGSSNMRLRISSPQYGLLSKVELIDHGYAVDEALDLYYMLGIEVGAYYPPYESQQVFSTSSYLHQTGEVQVNINKALIDGQIREYPFQNAWNQAPGVETGPVINVVMADDRPNKLLRIVPSSTILLEAILDDGGSGTVIDSISFVDVTTGEPTIPTGGLDTVFAIDKLANMSFTYDSSLLNMSLKDGVEQLYYKATYPEIGSMRLLQDGVPIQIKNKTTVPITIVEADCFDINGDANSWHQTLTSPTAKTTYIPINPFNTESTYTLEIYQSVGDTLICVVTFTYAGGWTAAVTVVDPPNLSCLGSAPLYYPALTEPFVGPGLALTFQDGEVDTETPSTWINGFENFDFLRATFKRKIFDNITASYQPNRYAPVFEAAVLKSILSDKSSKLIGLEHMIKNVSYIPIAGTLTIYIRPGYSQKPVYDTAMAILMEKFGYNNFNTEHTIDTQITAAILRSTLLSELAGDYGVTDIVYSDGNLQNLIDIENIEHYYQFIPDETLLLAIRQIELANPALTGLSSLFEMKIAVKTV